VLRRFLIWTLLGLAIGSNVGCFIPIYSGDPVKRTTQLIFTSEDLRTLVEQWERIWFLDQPSHMSPFRVHGGVI
jgi:hypothetical protein